MVDETCKVIFTRKAQRRYKQIVDFEQRRVSSAHARKVGFEIRKSARQLEKLPESRPILSETIRKEPNIRYTKAFSYKIIFTIFPKVREVVVLTIRNDAEDPDDVSNDLY